MSYTGPTSPGVDFDLPSGYTPPEGDSVDFLMGDATFSGTLAQTLSGLSPNIDGTFAPLVRTGVLAVTLAPLGRDIDATSNVTWHGVLSG